MDPTTDGHGGEREMADEQKEQTPTTPSWTVWQDEEQPDANGAGRRWRLKCSFCSAELKLAIAIPESGLRICPVCLGKMQEEINHFLKGSEP